MSTDPVAELVAHARQTFEEDLVRAGFVERRSHWQGTVSHGAVSTRVTLTLPSEFPFAPPRVKPAADDPVPWSWHRELDGSLCLVAEEDHHDLWWADAGTFLAHVQAWFAHSDAGWVDDRPDLDLERYFRSSDDTRLYLYGDLNEHTRSFVRFRPGSNNVMRLSGRGTRPTKPTRKLRDKFGYVAALGDIDVPPRGWADLQKRLDPSASLERQIRDRRVSVVALTYSRRSQAGAIMLEVRPDDDGGITARRLASASDTPQVRSARSGPSALELGRLSAVVVGLGAIGSFVADLLIRAGIGNLTLIDGDRVTPGNLVRHLVGPECVGMGKPTAVKRHLMHAHSIGASRIVTDEAPLTDASHALDLMIANDLVINATADYAVTALLHATAASAGTHIISAALQGEGATFRIDVLPPVEGCVALPPTAIDAPPSSAPEYFEPGCGSPVSRTPPHSVVEAAAATVRHAVGLLLHQPVHPAGEIRRLTPEERDVA